MRIVQIYVTATTNNTIISSQGMQKNITKSCGWVGFKGAKRSTPHAAQNLAESFAENLRVPPEKIGVVLLFRGIGRGRKSVLKGFLKKNIKILKIIEQTPIIHNGCRLRKKRRK